MTHEQEVAVYTTKDVDLDTILGQLGSGIKITIHRDEPRWCDGYLDTLNVDGDEPISLEDIRDMYGGRKLTVKVVGADGKIVARRTVKFPDEPKKDGVVVKNPSEPNKDDSELKSLTAMLVENQKAMAQMQAENAKTMLAMAQQHNETFQRMLQDRIKDFRGNGSGSGNGNGNSDGDRLSSVLSSLESIEAVRDRLKGEDPNTNVMNAAVPQILGMAEMALEKYLDNKMQQTQAGSQAGSQPSARPLPSKKVSSTGQSADDLSDEQFILQAIQRVKNMPDEKRNQITNLISQEFTTSQKNAPPADGDNDDTQVDQSDEMQIDIDPDDAKTLSEAGA